jgi:hypothetical protein
MKRSNHKLLIYILATLTGVTLLLTLLASLEVLTFIEPGQYSTYYKWYGITGVLFSVLTLASVFTLDRMHPVVEVPKTVEVPETVEN